MFPDADKNITYIENVCNIRRFPPKRKASDIDGENGWVYGSRKQDNGYNLNNVEHLRKYGLEG